MIGKIFDIQKFCTHDGPGIRTTVFVKGCPLRCLWCHNPESQSIETEWMHNPKKLCGYDISVEEVLEEVLKDKMYYDNSNGGMTISGGEPFFQRDFCLELLKQAKKHQLHTCVETCGWTSQDILKRSSEWIDLYLFDYKETNAEKHKRITRVDNNLILANLRYIDTFGKSIILRCPIVPGLNDNEEHFRGIADIANSLANLLRVEIEPYHTFGAEKYKRLGRSYELETVPSPNKEDVDEWMYFIQGITEREVRKA